MPLSRLHLSQTRGTSHLSFCHIFSSRQHSNHRSNRRQLNISASRLNTDRERQSERTSHVIPRKDTDDLAKFKGGISDFKDWKRKILDHLIIGTPKYETIIEALGKTQIPVTKADLTTSLLDGYNAWEVASELCAFTLRWLSTTMSDDRYMLCGGEGQEGNGFELRRNLHTNYMGSASRIVQSGGFKNFIRHGKCEDEKRLLKHCADWEEALTKYGGALRSDPVSLRTMFLSILPKAMDEKMMAGSKPIKYPTWQSVHK